MSLTTPPRPSPPPTTLEGNDMDTDMELCFRKGCLCPCGTLQAAKWRSCHLLLTVCSFNKSLPQQRLKLG